MTLQNSILPDSVVKSFDILCRSIPIYLYAPYFLSLLLVRVASEAGSHINLPDGVDFGVLAGLKGKQDMGRQIDTLVMRPIVQANMGIELPDFESMTSFVQGFEMDNILTNSIYFLEDLDFTSSRVDNDRLVKQVLELIISELARSNGRGSIEYNTPFDLVRLLVWLVDPKEGHEVYDPTAGIGSFLIQSRNYLLENRNSPESLRLYGQERNVVTAQLAKIILLINGLSADILTNSEPLGNPLISQGNKLKQFDRVISRLPLALGFDSGIDPLHDPYHRFQYGSIRRPRADSLMLQHMIASLKSDGVLAAIVTHGILFRGGSEAELRKNMVEADKIEAIIGLPSHMFSGTGVATAVLIINNKKPIERRNRILFVNAELDFEKELGRRSLSEAQVDRIVHCYKVFLNSERYSRVVDLEEIRNNLFDLSISRYVDNSELQSLLTQSYGTFKKSTLKDLAIEINSSDRDGNFVEKPNAIYVPRIVSKKPPVVDRMELGERGRSYFQVVIGESAIAGYVAQFLGSSVGQAALNVVANAVTMPQINKRSLGDCIIALPSLADQKEIVSTHHKIASLRSTINEIDKELALNPKGVKDFQVQLDSMLEVAGKLSNADRVRGLLRQGESKTIEFKETFSLDVKTQTKEKHIEQSALKTVVGFLNSDGGTLLIGVRDNQQVSGLDSEIEKLHKGNYDNFLKHLKNNIKSSIGEATYPLLNYELIGIDGCSVLLVECKPADSPCFLDDKDFYVRTNPATDKIDGLKQYEYIQRRFK